MSVNSSYISGSWEAGISEDEIEKGVYATLKDDGFILIGAFCQSGSIKELGAFPLCLTCFFFSVSLHSIFI
jgi:hypothetical protein